ncbi:MAG TPA: hypothetical protein VFF82_08675 [Rhodocyclaceae bacterium]|nr:hypothetical protein [Rhodocyclaceae bacterium]
MTNKLWIPALLAAATFSANSFAHGWEDHDGRGERHHHHGWYARMPAPPMPVYVQPRGYYPAPPAVNYREPVVYRSTPAYYERPVAYPAYYGDRVAAQAIGAIAGGVIGNQIGNGHVGPTLVGAVIGGAVGGHLAGY